MENKIIYLKSRKELWLECANKYETLVMDYNDWKEDKKSSEDFLDMLLKLRIIK